MVQLSITGQGKLKCIELHYINLFYNIDYLKEGGGSGRESSREGEVLEGGERRLEGGEEVGGWR